MVEENNIIDLIKINVDPNRGVTNTTIDNFARILCPNKYRGLYMDYDLKKMKSICKEPSFTLIVNTSQHFITIHAKRSFILFIDSFGMPCISPHVADFLQKCYRPVFYNSLQIQRITSKHCGLYALLFSKYFDKNSRKMTFRFSMKNNDHECMQYLEKLVNKTDY